MSNPVSVSSLLEILLNISKSFKMVQYMLVQQTLSGDFKHVWQNAWVNNVRGAVVCDVDFSLSKIV